MKSKSDLKRKPDDFPSPPPYHPAVRFLSAALLLLSTGPALAEENPLSVELISEAKAIVPGETFNVGLYLKPPSGFHTYWKHPGIVGVATSVEWTLPPGCSAGEIPGPAPRGGARARGPAHRPRISRRTPPDRPQHPPPGPPRISHHPDRLRFVDVLWRQMPPRVEDSFLHNSSSRPFRGSRSGEETPLRSLPREGSSKGRCLEHRNYPATQGHLPHPDFKTASTHSGRNSAWHPPLLHLRRPSRLRWRAESHHWPRPADPH